jgi:hypothetical protein
MKIMYESLALDYSTVFSIQEAIRRLGSEYANIRVEFDGDHTWVENVRMGTATLPITQIVNKIEARSFKQLDPSTVEFRKRNRSNHAR